MELMREITRTGTAQKVALACLAFLHLVLICALLNGFCKATSCIVISNTRMGDSYIQEELSQTGAGITAATARRRKLWGPGSYPPRCSGKCGKCTPCTPVHVPFPPGAPVTTTEYYPEAWRCKCGKGLYMP